MFPQALQVFQDIGRPYMMRPVPHAKAPLFQAYARLALHTPAWPLRILMCCKSLRTMRTQHFVFLCRD